MVSVSVTTLQAVLVTAAITTAITSMTTTAIIGARSGKETRTGIIKDTDRAGDQMIGPEPLLTIIIASVMVKFIIFLAVMGTAIAFAWLLSREV